MLFLYFPLSFSLLLSFSGFSRGRERCTGPREADPGGPARRGPAECCWVALLLLTVYSRPEVYEEEDAAMGSACSGYGSPPAVPCCLVGQKVSLTPSEPSGAAHLLSTLYLSFSSFSSSIHIHSLKEYVQAHGIYATTSSCPATIRSSVARTGYT